MSDEIPTTAKQISYLEHGENLGFDIRDAAEVIGLEAAQKLVAAGFVVYHHARVSILQSTTSISEHILSTSNHEDLKEEVNSRLQHWLADRLIAKELIEEIIIKNLDQQTQTHVGKITVIKPRALNSKQK